MSLVSKEGTQTPQEIDLVHLTPAKERLSPFLVMTFLSRGIFPWLYKNGQRLWWSPEPRSVLIFSDLHISRSLRKTLRKNKFRVTADTAFEQVIRKCGDTRENTWINKEIIEVFTDLHKMGHAHSIEVWDQDGNLVGGLYGVCIGELFCGFSMFHTVPSASKVALVKLVELLASWRIPLLDCQMHNPYLQKMGARVIPRTTFHRIVSVLVRQPRRIGSWEKYFPSDKTS